MLHEVVAAMMFEFMRLERAISRRGDFGNDDLAANLTSIIDEYWQLGRFQTDNQLLQKIKNLGREMREDVPTYTASPTVADIHFVVEGEMCQH